MSKRFYIIYISILAVALCACTKEDIGNTNGLPYITFGVSGISIDTKGLITNSDFTSNSNPLVYVYGAKNNNNNAPIFNGTPIYKEEDSYNWKTSQNQQKQWEADSSYSFHGYTYSPQSPTLGSSIDINTSGLKITVSQPDSYSENDMIDYMLSHAYKVADGTNYRTVMLYMQHAMAWVEIVAKKEILEHQVTLDSITVSNIYRSAVMQCESQAVANSGGKNIWTIQLSGRNNQIYKKKKNSFSPANDTLGTMRLLAVPQQLTNATELTVNYSVNEPSGEKQYTETFNLFNYTPYVWSSGNKITYNLTINTGVSLKAEIAEWKEGGYTEGVIIPKNN